MTALTLARMRADVAEMLGEAPEDISTEENLMDLGLDSMRVLGLVLAWGNTGIALEFSHLAEHATLGGWWTVVQRLQAQAAASA
ncbi:phosphopantetheine-binding protein [Stenotrophomonas rhizophila]|uniref:Aryl carrier-like protein n=1 Tax=Stenotrophomonas rhizophila TaxID=216778 RepID=A0A498CQY5_9GAMM|nr:phosphopantetheine-binding protein [Stenotrophomonas rhizophila]KAB7628122.1 phosphopantetheine-binding protein [Stenotrophomonas rhizophila]MBU2050854.1 phosphopantetheine-binding protein [Gammaproteobacteria bacterium]RLK56032.1 aryl carrier-like protein [Stenotrophomonas rhizophila]